ncbi:hypothetical protein ACI2LF_40530 [Kribbella sp. NPDC020789]|uniref:hypothetical protein n=1 Tax=Streptomyces TaxID=1883 RepID=UPI00193B6B2C|nr:hypothetical protein [Streptomyces sp. S-9]
MTTHTHTQQLAAHIRSRLGDGPFLAPGGWSHMGAVICDASFQARRNYASTIRPRILHLQTAWPDANTVRGFRARLATEDLAAVMNFKAPRRVATAHHIAELLATSGVDTRDDLHAWLEVPDNRAALRTVNGVGPKTVDYIGNLVGRSQIAIDTHLRAFAAQAGIVGLTYHQLRTVYEAAATLLGHDRGGLEHAVWRHRAQAR